MKVVLFSFAALILFGVIPAVVSTKFPKTPALTIMTGYLGTTFFLSLITVLFRKSLLGEEVGFPKGSLLGLLLLIGVIVFIANLFYISALREGEKHVVTIMTILSLVPIISVAILFFWRGVRPSPIQLVGCLLAVLAVYCVSRPPTSGSSSDGEETSTSLDS